MYAAIPAKYHLYVLTPGGCLDANKPGNQKNIIHQYSPIFWKTSIGIVPKSIKTKNPTKPDINRILGDQNLYKNSDITHKPIETPNRSNPIPIP